MRTDPDLEPTPCPSSGPASPRPVVVPPLASPTTQAMYREARKAADHAFHVGYLTQILVETGGNVTEAARRAGVDRSNFRRLLQQYGLVAPAESAPVRPMCSKCKRRVLSEAQVKEAAACKGPGGGS